MFLSVLGLGFEWLSLFASTMQCPPPSKECLLGHVEDENHFIRTALNLWLETIDLQSWETIWCVGWPLSILLDWTQLKIKDWKQDLHLWHVHLFFPDMCTIHRVPSSLPQACYIYLHHERISLSLTWVANHYQLIHSFTSLHVVLTVVCLKYFSTIPGDECFELICACFLGLGN